MPLYHAKGCVRSLKNATLLATRGPYINAEMSIPGLLFKAACLKLGQNSRRNKILSERPIYEIYITTSYLKGKKHTFGYEGRASFRRCKRRQAGTACLLSSFLPQLNSKSSKPLSGIVKQVFKPPSEKDPEKKKKNVKHQSKSSRCWAKRALLPVHPIDRSLAAQKTTANPSKHPPTTVGFY